MTEAPAAPPRRVPLGLWAILVVGLVCYGLSSILVRAAGDVNPLAIAAWRTLFVTGLLAPAALVRARAELACLSRREWALVGASGVLLGLHFAAWITSVQLTTIASASVLVTMSPLWLGVLGLVGVGERPRRRTLFAIAGGTLGAVLIGVGGHSGPVPPNAAVGNVLALGAAALIALYYLAGRSVRQGASFLAYFTPVNAIAAATAFAILAATGAPLGLPPSALVWCFVMAIGPGLIGHGSFAFALGYLPAALLSLLTLAEPVFASAIAAALFGETPGPVAALGMAVVLVSIGVAVGGRQ